MNAERICIEGKKYDVISKLEEILGVERDVAADFLTFLENEKAILSEEERCEVKTSLPPMKSGYMHMMVMEHNYYINITVATAFIISSLIDAQIKWPITAGGLAIRGMNRMVEKIDEQLGEKCILLELLRKPSKSANCDVLVPFKEECCNNDLSCTYRCEDKCQCSPEDVKNIMDKLANMGVLKKCDMEYKYTAFGNL